MNAVRLPSLSVGTTSSAPSLRWPSGKPLVAANLNKFNPEPLPSASTSARPSEADLEASAQVEQAPVGIPEELRPVEQFVASFRFECSTSASTSALIDGTAEAASTIDRSQAEVAVVQLLLSLAALLAIPRGCNAPDVDDVDAPELLQRERFLQVAPSLLQLCLALARLLPPIATPASPAPAMIRRRAELALAFATFTDADAPFHSEASAQTATDLCDLILVPDSALRHPIAHHILATLFPPMFKPHPKLNPQTGRVLSRPVGGDRGMSDWYEEAEDGAGWRTQPGLAGVVKLVVASLEPSEFESEWPLVLPPLLAFLDDYSAPNKLAGTHILAVLLNKVEPSLLVRTGVGKIFEKSLASCFSSLGDACGPQLLTAALATSINLIKLLYPLHSTPAPTAPASVALSLRAATPGTTPAEAASLARFNALSALFSSSVLHGWQFHGGKKSLETATSRALVPLLDAFENNSGAIRFLQALIPHLCALVELEGLGVEGAVEMRIAAGEALLYVVRRAEVRMKRWRPRVLAAVGKAWVGLREGDERESLAQGTGREGLVRLESLLQEVVASLRAGEAGEEDVARLLALDPTLFGELCSP